MDDDFINEIIKAHKRTFQRAFEIAVRTGTALVYSEDKKVVEIYPPYKYELVPIKSKKKKSKT
jgi:hypothetical protein